MDIKKSLTGVMHIAGAIASLTVASVLIYASSPALSATFTYTNPSCTGFQISGTPPTQTVTCVTSGGGGSGAPVCTPTANPTSPIHGNSTTITANCTNSPTSYVWTGSGCLSATSSCTVTKSHTATVQFSVQAINASGTGNAAPITVTWQ